MEHIKNPFIIEGYVVKDLSHAINLGQQFLRRYSCELFFRPSGVHLKVGHDVTPLQVFKTDITRPSIDTRITRVLETYKAAGCNPIPHHKTLQNVPNKQMPPGIFFSKNKNKLIFGAQKFRAHLDQPVKLLPGTQTVCSLVLPSFQPKHDNFILLEPKTDVRWLNKHEIFVHGGVLHQDKGKLNVLIGNYSPHAITIPTSQILGHLHQLESISEKNSNNNEGINSLNHNNSANLSKEELKERREYIIEGLKLNDNLVLKDHPDEKEEVINIFLNNFDAVSINDDDFGQTNVIDFKIRLHPNTTPCRAKVRPLNPAQEKNLAEQISEWLKGDIISPCGPEESEWASAMVPVLKKGSDPPKYRWCLDYRYLNSKTTKDSYPLPSIDNNLHKLSGAKYFSSLDSIGAFHNIKMHQESQPLTSFICPQGMYKFLRVPFGVTNGPAAYSRLVDKVLSYLPPGFTLGYIDDIICFSTTLKEHIKHLKDVVELHKRFGLKLKLAKCHIIREEVKYLGHLVNKHGIKMVPEYVEKVLSWPLPTTGKDLRSFLGFTSYYRAYIKNYASLTSEMQKLKMQENISWPPSVEAKFVKLKTAFKEGPVRAYPKFDIDSPFILSTDYSSTNLAAILSQVQDGKEAFIGCVAKKCNKAQENYGSMKGELASIMLGLDRWEHILRFSTFIIRTDSKALEQVQRLKKHNGIWARWISFLDSFTFEIQYRKGTLNKPADALSRMPGLTVEPEQEPERNNFPNDVADVCHVNAPNVNNPKLKGKGFKIDLNLIRNSQESDPVLNKIIEFVKLNHKPTIPEQKGLSSRGIDYVQVFECLSLYQGILCYRNPKLKGESNPDLRYCLPPDLQTKAFLLCHSHKLSGHSGVTETTRRLQRKFYWPGLPNDVGRFISNCIACLRKRTSAEKETKHIMHRELCSYFGEKLYIDIVGPLTPKMYNGKVCRYILTMLDGFTRYLVAVPLPTQDTPHVVQALIDNYILLHGIPQNVFSDRGSNFTSNLFLEVCKVLKIDKQLTPAYSPQANRVERAHRSLFYILRTDESTDPSNWTDKLKYAVFSYNISVNRYLGISPFEALYQRKAVLPVDLCFAPPNSDQQSEKWSSYVRHLKERFQYFTERLARTEQNKISIEIKKNMTRATRKPMYEGQLCYLFIQKLKQNVSKKLQSRYIGPFRVQRVISNSVVIIYPVGTWCTNPKEMSVIISRLAPIDEDILSKLNYKTMTEETEKVDLNDLDEETDENTIEYSENFPSTLPNIENNDPEPMEIDKTLINDNLQGFPTTEESEFSPVFTEQRSNTVPEPVHTDPPATRELRQAYQAALLKISKQQRPRVYSKRKRVSS